MAKIPAFQVLGEMSRRNLKSIRGFGLSLITSARVGKKEGSITIRVDKETATKVMLQQPIRFMLIVADDEEYRKVEEEMEKVKND